MIYDDGKETHRLQGLYLPHRDAVFPATPARPPQLDAPTLDQFSQELAVPTPREHLEKCLNLSTAEPQSEGQATTPKPPEIEWDEIPDYLHELIQFSIRVGWVTARKIKSDVSLYRSSSTDEIRSFFLAAQNLGWG